MSRQRSTWEDEERWSPEDEAEARWEASHLWPASFRTLTIAGVDIDSERE